MTHLMTRCFQTRHATGSRLLINAVARRRNQMKHRHGKSLLTYKVKRLSCRLRPSYFKRHLLAGGRLKITYRYKDRWREIKMVCFFECITGGMQLKTGL